MEFLLQRIPFPLEFLIKPRTPSFQSLSISQIVSPSDPYTRPTAEDLLQGSVDYDSDEVIDLIPVTVYWFCPDISLVEYQDHTGAVYHSTLSPSELVSSFTGPRLTPTDTYYWYLSQHFDWLQALAFIHLTAFASFQIAVLLVSLFK